MQVRNDSKSALARSNLTANLWGLALGCIGVDVCKEMLILYSHFAIFIFFKIYKMRALLHRSGLDCVEFLYYSAKVL